MTDRPVAMVTGASRGIGRAVALALARGGFDVAVMSRRHADADEPCGLIAVGREIQRAGVSALPVHADVADLEEHEEVLARVHARFGRLDVFVSNAGIAPDPRRDLLDMTPESFDRLIAVNLRGAVFLAQKVARRMVADARTSRGAARSIVFITSVSAERSSTNRAEYCVSKAGLSMAARVFADRLAGDGIRVFEVRPGIIDTDMTAPAKEKYDAMIADGLVPERRWGTPEDVARAVVALVRGDFDYSTGMIVDVSGGLSMPRL